MTERTKRLWDRLSELFVEERKKGVLDISQIPSSITAHLLDVGNVGRTSTFLDIYFERA